MFRQAIGREVLTKRRGHKLIRLIGELPRPVQIMFARIMAQRTIGPAVDFRFCLFITFQTQFRQHQFAIDLNFANCTGAASRVVLNLAAEHVYWISHLALSLINLPYFNHNYFTSTAQNESKVHTTRKYPCYQWK